MRRVVSFFIVVLAVFLGGCIRVSTHITVMKNGSGTVTERVLMNTPLLKAIATSSKEGENRAPGSMPDRKSLEKNAKDMGEGVRLKSVRKYIEGGFEGYEAKYHFRDITKVRVSGTPDDKASVDSLRAGSISPSRKERISFRFSGGEPSQLVIVLPAENAVLGSPKPADTPKQPPTAEQQKLSLAIMREFFRGTRITLAVEVGGTIVRTDAACREGSQIILADVDFDRVLEAGDDKTLLNLSGYGSSPDIPKEMLNRVPGMKGESKREVNVVFQ
ncbi:MAG: hypothetical protein FJZ79_02670 [Chlorobi bacterium]|nr:hypothetical protein [Chlorobiota bacterium]